MAVPYRGRQSASLSRKDNTMYVDNLIGALKGFDADRMSVDDMVVLSVNAEALAAGFTAKSLPVPLYVSDAIRKLDREIKERGRDAREKRLREKMAERDGMLTAAEKRERLDAEVAALKAELG